MSITCARTYARRGVMLAITGDIHRPHRRRHVGRRNAVIVFRTVGIHDESRKIDSVIGEELASDKAIYKASGNRLDSENTSPARRVVGCNYARAFSSLFYLFRAIIDPWFIIVLGEEQ